MTDDKDYDALAAKLADAERVARYETDIAQQALNQIKAEKARADAAEAKLAEVTDDCDDLQIALASARKQLERYIGEAEAALVAVYRLALEKCEAACQIEIDRGDKNNAFAYAVGARSCQAAIRALPTPTAAELMARIQTGENK